MEKRRVDFQQIKKTAGIVPVLSRYGVELRKSGESLRGSCPLPCGELGGKGCFSVSLQKQVYKCHHKGCGWAKTGGDVLDLVKGMEGVSLREAGLKLAEWFPVGESSEAAAQAANSKPEGLINPPLGFELKSLDVEAGERYALGRGLSDETVVSFGLAVASRGRFKGRLVIPLHDKEGQLVGVDPTVVL